jgi:hypothetical protein
MRTTLDALLPRAARVAAGFITIAALVAGCKSDVTQPGAADESRVRVDPSHDLGPAFTLKTLQAGEPGRQTPVTLIGQNVHVDDAGLVTIDVAAVNNGEHALRELTVWLSSFQPSDVLPFNADVLPVDDVLPPNPAWGYDYASLSGDDGVLSPDEMSNYKAWQFQAPALAAFSFAARASVAVDLQPGGRISGLVFWDANQNGRLERGEELLAAGSLRLDGPNGLVQETHVGADARYTFGVDAPGMYSVEFLGSPFAAPMEFVLTTPNPLQVILLSDGSGGVQSFDAAHFGARPFRTNAATPIQITDRLPGAIRQDHYQLADLKLDGHVLHTRVGFSGCSPDHPLQLYMSGGFMESHPVQARLVLMHDDRGEMCDAAWSAERAWDLSPIVRLYAQQYRSRTGTVVLRLTTPNGDQHEVRFTF